MFHWAPLVQAAFILQFTSVNSDIVCFKHPQLTLTTTTDPNALLILRILRPVSRRKYYTTQCVCL